MTTLSDEKLDAVLTAQAKAHLGSFSDIHVLRAKMVDDRMQIIWSAAECSACGMPNPVRLGAKFACSACKTEDDALLRAEFCVPVSLGESREQTAGACRGGEPDSRESERKQPMKTIENFAAQGDVMFLRVPALPDNAAAEPRAGRLVLAHSETGHHHAIDDDGVVRFDVGDPLICYLRVDGLHADVTHHKTGPDAHKTLRLTPGIWRVTRGREMTPEGWRRTED